MNNFEALSRKVFWKNINLRSVLGKEIDDLKELKGVPSEWKFLIEIEGRTLGSIDRRNFFAHGGLEKNAVELRQLEEGLELKYSEKRKKNIQKFILQVLK